MYCKNCSYPITLKDEFCPNCTELMTEFTIIDSSQKNKNINEEKKPVNEQSRLPQKISKKGQRYIGIGLLLILVQVFAYISSNNFLNEYISGSHTYRLLGSNTFIILGVISLIKGLLTTEDIK